MKKILFPAILLLLCLTNIVYAQSLPAFDRILLTGNISVLLVEGDQENMEIKNDADQLEFTVEGRALKITSKNLIKYNQQPTVKVIVTFTKLREIKARAGASIYTQQNIESDALHLRFSSGAIGELTVEGNSIKSSVSEGASLDLRGSTIFHEVKAVTGGSISAFDLDAKEVIVKANTGGSAKVLALDSINASAKTGGSVSYRGNPKKVREKDGLSGTIKAY